MQNLDQRFLLRVGKTLEQLRCAFLGQNLPLLNVLDYSRVIPFLNSRAIAAQLIFALVNQNDWSSEQIAAAERWLQAAIHYIFRETNREEHTFCSLLKLTNAPNNFLVLVDTSQFDKPDRPQFLTNQILELGIFALMESKGLLEEAKRALDTAEKMLNQSSSS